MFGYLTSTGDFTALKVLPLQFWNGDGPMKAVQEIVSNTGASFMFVYDDIAEGHGKAELNNYAKTLDALLGGTGDSNYVGTVVIAERNGLTSSTMSLIRSLKHRRSLRSGHKY